MTETTAKIRAKGLDGTGFTEDLAASLFNRVGHNLKAIVELQVVDKHGPNLDGKRGIELVITGLEVADDSNLEDHLREISHTLYYNRGLQGHVGTTTEGQERTVADVLSAGGKFRPHPFLPVDASEDNPICDVCGGIEASAVHSTQDILDDPEIEEDPEPYVDTEGDFDDYDADPDHQSPHAYDAGPDDSCQCGLAFEDDIHRFAGETGVNTVPDPFATPATT